MTAQPHWSPVADSLTAYLATLDGRCADCGAHVKTQGHVGGCLATGQRLADQGMARAASAHPDERATVDAAIRRLAAAGDPFSANEVRELTGGVRGGVVGAAFNAASQGRSAVIRATGEMVRSTDPGTHGHRINTYVGCAA